MRLIPYEVMGGVARHLEELPVAYSVEEAKNHIINLPRHLSGRHIEYVEEPDDGPLVPGEVGRDGIKPCEGYDDT